MTGVSEPSYSDGASGVPLLGETIGANLRRVAARHPDREAVVDVPSGRRWTYAGLDLDTDGLARGLIAVGIEAGDRVGIWAPNCAEWVLLQYATAKAGIVLVNINPAYRSSELGYALRQSGVRLLVSAESFKTSNYRAMVDEVRGGPDAPAQLERVIYLGSPEWEELLAAGAGVPGELGPLADREAGLSFDDPINIQYTSGTTASQRATLSHHSISTTASDEGLPRRGWTGSHPGALLPLLRHGLGSLTPTGLHRHPSPRRARRWRRWRSGAPPCGVPTMFIIFIADFAADLSTLRTGIMAGRRARSGDGSRSSADTHDEVTICTG
jgi:fatty-acyl-CoA synthase